jgi:hypothetical protein
MPSSADRRHRATRSRRPEVRVHRQSFGGLEIAEFQSSSADPMSFVAPQALLDAVQPLLGSTIGDDAVRAPS